MVNKKIYKFDVHFLIAILIAYFLTYFLLYSKLFSEYSVITQNDIYVHANLINLIETQPEVFFGIISYPLWHLIVWLGNILTGIDLFYVSIIITSMFNAFSVGLLYFIFKKKLKMYIKADLLICFLSVAVIIIMPIYAPWFNKYFALGQWSPNSWHNPTYIAVRPVALLIVFYWIELNNKYFCGNRKISNNKLYKKPKIHIKEALILSILLILSLFLKPSFVQFFIPAAFLFLIIECILSKGDNLIFLIQSVIIFLIPVILFIIQYSLLFNGGERIGIGFGFANSWSLFTENIFISFLLSALFPLFVIITNFKKLYKNKFMFFSLIMLIIALCEYIFIYEIGYEKDNNIGWGYMLALFLIWIFSIIMFLKSYFIEKNQLTLIKNINVTIGFGLLFIYIIYGIYYYIWSYGTYMQLF